MSTRFAAVAAAIFTHDLSVSAQSADWLAGTLGRKRLVLISNTGPLIATDDQTTFLACAIQAISAADTGSLDDTDRSRAVATMLVEHGLADIEGIEKARETLGISGHVAP